MQLSDTQRNGSRTRALLVVPALLIVVRLAAFAQNNCVQIARESPELLSLPPGQVLTTAVRVHNPSPVHQKYEARLILPGGWRSLTNEGGFELDAGNADIRLISIAIPPAAAPGAYQIHYSVSNDAVPPCWMTFTIDVQVEPLRNLQLQVAESPRYAVAGDMFKALFDVTNRGNEPSEIRLSVRSGQGWTARPESTMVTLAARQTRRIAVDVLADQSATQNFRYVVELKATLASDSTVIAMASFPIDIVPRGSAGADLYHELPLTARIRSAGDQHGAGAQIELAGGGKLTDKGTDNVELFLRTPDIQSRSVLGYHDEYRISYTSQHYALYAGDKSYELSPLTELARNAIGAEAMGRAGDVTVGGFINQTRFFSPVQKEQAGYVKYGFDSTSSASVNFLRKDDITQSNMVTLRGNVRPIGQNDLDLEAGASTLNGVGDQAIAARLQGIEDWASYEVRFVRAGTNYGGYYRDVEFRSGSFSLQPWQRLHVDFYGRDERRNLNLDTMQFVAPRDQYYLVGAGYGDLVSVYYRTDDQADRLPDAKYAAREHAVQVRSGYTMQLATFMGTAEVGSTDDRVLNQSSPFQRIQLSANVRPEAHQSYGVSVEYSNERFFNAGESTGRWSGSLSAGIFLSQGTQIMANIEGSRTAAPFVQTYSMVDLSIEHTFPFGHTVTLRGRQSIFAPASDGKEIAYLLEYSVPMSIPVSRLSASGQLRGSIRDAQSQRGIGGILLYAGEATAVSSEAGEFVFPGLQPNVYHLQVDLGSLGMDRVTTVPTPIDVSVRGGEETTIDLGVIPGATIRGSVLLFGIREPQPVDTTRTEYIELRGQPNVLVEISRDGETQRRIADNKGRFQFQNVRPGTWTMRIQDGNIPQYHYFEHDTATVIVGPSEQRQVMFRVLPRKRTIQILEEGRIPEQSPANEPRTRQQPR